MPGMTVSRMSMRYASNNDMTTTAHVKRIQSERAIDAECACRRVLRLLFCIHEITNTLLSTQSRASYSFELFDLWWLWHLWDSSSSFKH